METEKDEYDFEEGEVDSSDFLANLENDQFVEPLTEKEQNKQMKAYEKHQKMMEKQERQREIQGERLRKQAIRMEKEKKKDEPKEALEDDGLFSENSTKILGKDRLILLKKINQFKTLFPKQLGKFKLKKNPTLEDLSIALEECNALIEVNSADEFVLSSIMESLKMMESFSANTIYDIRGMSIALQNTPQFNTLMKILFIKYSVFSNVPVEYQLMMVIFSTGYLCIQKNKGKQKIDAYLNEPL